MTDYTKTVVDVSTGKVTIVPLTDEEIIEIQSRSSAKVVPLSISYRQFFQQAAIDGIITQAEALDAVKTKEMPTLIQNIINTIPDDNQKFAAQMLLVGAVTFERNHSLIEIFKTSLDWTDDMIDQFFIDAEKL